MMAARALSPFDVGVIAVLLASGALYAVGTMRLRDRRGDGVRCRVSFWLGWLALLIAVTPPLDAWSIERFSAHMIQHELMMLVAAPLLMAGRPIQVWLMALPPATRAVVAASLQSSAVSTSWRAATSPLAAWALHGSAIWLWHAPPLYDAAVGNEAVHALQHAMFVGTAVLFWWGMLYGRYGRAGYGAAVFYVFTTVVHTGLLGAALTFAGVPLYDVYLAPASAHGLDALEDQQLAGLLMWVPAGFVLTLLGIALFAAWLGEAGRRRAAVVLLAISVGAGVGCAPSHEQTARAMTGGDPRHGREALARYGCDTCHTIPGVPTADATVGPPLNRIAMRTYLAGRLHNTPENLMRWIRQPRAVDPETAMPDTGVTERDGRDIAAYLYTLR